MIIVSGFARTGTSMLMQTLIHLGLDTPAKPFIDEHRDIVDKNPKGFYELYDEVKDGVQHDLYSNQAVKMFPGCLFKTPKQYVSKVIVMQRDRDDSLKSYAPIHEIFKEEIPKEVLYDLSYTILTDYIVDVDHIFINFEEIRSNPEVEIKRLVKFLNLEPTKKQMLNAINNIDICHY